MPSIRLLARPALRQNRPQRLHPTTTTALTRPYSSAFQQGPSPPRLPADQQAEFERLQRAVSERIADPTPLPHEQQTPAPSPASTSRHTSTPTTKSSTTAAQAVKADDDVLPTAVQRGARPEFEGDTNPKTGEVGGPKNEPLRWGSGGDWSYNGRVTDF